MYLTEYQETMLWSGTVFRFPAKYPFEAIVDFMLMDYPDTESRFAIYCVSGCYAGTRFGERSVMAHEPNRR